MEEISDWLHCNKNWIKDTLKRHGNCYISELVDLEELEKATGFKLRIRFIDCGGYIIEVVK